MVAELVVSTHWHSDHVGGNAAPRATGAAIAATHPCPTEGTGPTLAERLAETRATRHDPSRRSRTPMSWTIERHGRVAVVTMTTNPVNAQNRVFFADPRDAFDRLEKDHPTARSC